MSKREIEASDDSELVYVIEAKTVCYGIVNAASASTYDSTANELRKTKSIHTAKIWFQSKVLADAVGLRLLPLLFDGNAAGCPILVMRVSLLHVGYPLGY